ncbi:hypothetical protein [Amnibacterium setariae]|nr:hypothetical protein [Amnibacterium setariae]
MAAVPVWSTAGSMDWPETIVLVARTSRVFASTELGDPAQQVHASVSAIC